MQGYQILLIFLLVGCVAALFFIWMKNRNAAPEPEEAPPEPEPARHVIVPVVDPTPAPTPIPVYPVPPGESNQRTIYAFERTVPVVMCPRCDGENSPIRSVCCICGFEFRKGVRQL